MHMLMSADCMTPVWHVMWRLSGYPDVFIYSPMTRHKMPAHMHDY